MPTHDLTPFLDVRQTQLGLEFSESDAIDAKALALLASNLAILIFIVQSPLDVKAWSMLAIIVALAVAAVLTVITIWPRTYAGASVSMHDHPEYLRYDKDRLIEQLIADTELAITTNMAINRFRRWICAVSLAVTSVTSLFLFILLYFK